MTDHARSDSDLSLLVASLQQRITELEQDVEKCGSCFALIEAIRRAEAAEARLAQIEAAGMKESDFWERKCHALEATLARCQALSEQWRTLARKVEGRFGADPVSMAIENVADDLDRALAGAPAAGPQEQK